MLPLKGSHRIALDAYFDGNKHCAFNLDELSDFITGNRAAWGFPKSWSTRHTRGAAAISVNFISSDVSTATVLSPQCPSRGKAAPRWPGSPVKGDRFAPVSAKPTRP